jgi:hypothetical protein
MFCLKLHSERKCHGLGFGQLEGLEHFRESPEEAETEQDVTTRGEPGKRIYCLSAHSAISFAYAKTSLDLLCSIAGLANSAMGFAKLM